MVAALLAAAPLASGCGAEFTLPKVSRPLTPASSNADRRVVAASQVIFDYCALTTGGHGGRSRAGRALRVIEREYRRSAGSPYAGQGRDGMRQALLLARNRLALCDPALAREAETGLAS